jgi:hypothetical protein
VHTDKERVHTASRGCTQVGKGAHMGQEGTHTTGRGGVHGLWVERARVEMEARTTIAFTNFRV